MPKNIFKSKFFGGYDPADVAGYIEKINAQAAIEIEDAEKISGKLREDKEKLSNEIKDLKAQLDSQKNNVESVNVLLDKIDEHKSKIAELENEKQGILEELELTKKLYEELQEKDAQLKADFDALSLRYASVSEDSNSYAKTCRDAGNILLIAQSKSEEVLDEANKNADIIIASAKISANEIIAKASAQADQYAARVKSEADTYSKETRLKADTHVQQTKEKVEFLMERQKQLLAALQSQKSEIAKFYDETVSGLSDTDNN